MLKEKNADAIISVCEMEHSPLWSNTLDENLDMSNFLRDEVLNKRSQDLPKYYGLMELFIFVKQINYYKIRFLKENIYAYKMNKNTL